MSFRSEIAPILIAECLGCHAADKAKGGYQLHQFGRMRTAGDSGMPPVTPGHPERSELYRRLVATDPDEMMPQKGERLAPEKIELVARWIREGAKLDAPDETAPLVSLAPREPHPEPPEVYAHPAPVLAAAFHPKAPELVSGGYHEALVWHSETGKLLRRIQRLPERIQRLCFNEAGTVLAVAGGGPGRYGEILLVDMAAGAAGAPLASASDLYLALDFDRAGERLAAGGADNGIVVLDSVSGAEKLRIHQHADWVMDVAFSGDGGRLVSASRDRSARIYNAMTGELELSYPGHEAPVMAARFNADGTVVASCDAKGRVHLWSARDGKKERDFPVSDKGVWRLLFHKGDVLSACGDGSIRKHGESDGKLRGTFWGHSDWAFSLALDAERKKLAAGSHNGEIWIWDLETGAAQLEFVAAPGWKK